MIVQSQNQLDRAHGAISPDRMRLQAKSHREPQFVPSEHLRDISPIETEAESGQPENDVQFGRSR